MRGRHVTTAVTLVVLLLILAVAAVVGVRTLLAPVGDDTGGDAGSCTTSALRKGQRVASSQVQVSVFNAGSRAGLADTVMGRLRGRGFTEGDLGNAPSGTRVKVVQVWTTEKDDAAARLVARQFGATVAVRRVDRDLGTGVDVVVGDGFRSLAKAPRSLVVKRAQAACLPSSSATDG